jgi:uncharacterized protein
MIIKNGLYLTREDFEQWQDYFSNLIRVNEPQYNNICNDCKLGSQLRVKDITFVVTEKCNLACTYCYETHKTGRRMSKQIAKDAVDFLFDENKVNGYYTKEESPGLILEFIGGEPLLEIDLINEIVEYFKFKAFSLNHPWVTNYTISISTNGVLFNSKKVQDFLKRNLNKVSITITIDGNKELHDSCRIFPDGTGSYEIVEKSIKNWLKFNNIPQTKITLSPFNIKYLNNALKNIWNLGIIAAFTNCIYEEGWNIEHAKIFYNELINLADYLLENENYRKYYTSLFDDSIGQYLIDDKNWCGGNGEMLAIGTDGKCYPCIRFMNYSLSTLGREEKSVGDIYNGLDNKNGNEWLKKLNLITMSSQSNEICNNCKIASGCSLCTGYNYDKFGDPNHRATYICIMHQARVLANYYYWNKLYKMVYLNKHFNLNIPKDWALNIIDNKTYEELLEKGGE